MSFKLPRKLALLGLLALCLCVVRNLTSKRSWI